MGNRRDTRSRRLETPYQIEKLMYQFTEPRQISNEIQVWPQNMELKFNDRIEKMRVEMENKLKTISKEIKSNK